MANYNIISISCALCVFLRIVYCTAYVKGLYCQDPDTKKLYPINSTWQSETFCGNYTCKMRKKNFTETEYTPITKINITSQHLVGNNDDSNNIVDDMSTSPSDHSFVIEKLIPEKQPVFHKDVHNKINEFKEELKNNETGDTDRYLTESEIKTITEILHTIKKSDLEAIVEIYNIAQDIYKEMDMTTAEKFVKDTINNLKTDEIKSKKMQSDSSKNSISYWYEPLQPFVKPKPADLKTESTNVAPVAQPSYPATYFNGPLKEKDFGKLPYYYPISNFHRTASYLHNPYSPQKIAQEVKPCSQQMASYVQPAWYKPIANNNVQPFKRSTTPQPILLPYPFSYVHHYNNTYPASYYYSNYPWAQLDVYKNKYYPQPYYGTYGTKSPATVIIANENDLEGSYDEQNGIDDAVNKETELPAWQTEPLSDKVLEEVRANVLENSKLIKPLSLRKSLKLEKVGKVIKLDELTRSKREAEAVKIDEKREDSDEYETYVEKTTCESSTEPGYFSVGNESQPFPACCPQKIYS